MAFIPLVRPVSAILALCGAGALASGVPSAQQLEPRATNQQRVFVSVVDKKGIPATGLAVTDFTIREDGRAREVLNVEPATGPLDVALLVDTSATTAGAIPDLRDALKAFADALWANNPDTQIALYSFGERPSLEADSSSSAVNLGRRIDRLFATPGSGAYFIDAVIDAAKSQTKSTSSRRVIVAYVDENGPEFSNRRHDYVYDVVAAAQTSLWAVARQGFGSSTSTVENRERAMVIGDVTMRSGGRSAMVFDSTGLKTQFTNIATQLLSQFMVTYGRVDSLIPPERLEIKLTNSDLRLASPRWTTR
jgi:hypothetical protein